MFFHQAPGNRVNRHADATIYQTQGIRVVYQQLGKLEIVPRDQTLLIHAPPLAGHGFGFQRRRVGCVKHRQRCEHQGTEE